MAKSKTEKVTEVEVDVNPSVVDLAVGEPTDELKQEDPPAKVVVDDVPAGACTTAQLTEATGVSQAVLSGWLTAGVVYPSIRRSVQGGKPALWSKSDVVQVKALREMLDVLKQKFSVDAILKAIVIKRSCTSDQVAILTANGPRIVDRTTPLSAIKRMTQQPVILL